MTMQFGVTVLPEYFQSEGVESVLDRLQGVGVTAVTTSPYVMEPADQRTGHREPPIDAGAGSVRLLDRPLWGHRELWVRTAPSFEAQRSCYAGLRYQPPPADHLTKSDGSLVDRVIAAAKARNIAIFFQVQAAIPPGYRVQFGGPHEDDLPRMHDGRVPADRVANNGSLASPEIRAYGAAMLTDLSQRYPDLDGIRIDWPEYPPYSLDDMFVDFSTHAETLAAEWGCDFASMRHDAARLYEGLHGGLTDDKLTPWLAPDRLAAALSDLVLELPGVAELTRFKQRLTAHMVAGYRQALDAAGAEQMQLIPNLFPWPWSLASGAATYRAVAPHSAALAVKLYGMHWKMMFRFYAVQLAAANPTLTPCVLIRALLTVLDIMDEPADEDVSAYRYPAPNEPHGVGVAAQQRKLLIAQQFAGETPVWPLVHGYGPVDDFQERFRVVRAVSPPGIWINRYGYLSDAKLGVAERECATAIVDG